MHSLCLPACQHQTGPRHLQLTSASLIPQYGFYEDKFGPIVLGSLIMLVRLRSLCPAVSRFVHM